MSYSYYPKNTKRTAQRSRRGARPPQRSSGTRKRGKNQGEYIDPKRFVKAASTQEAQAYVPTHSFSDFTLSPLLHANLARKNYSQPSPIQDQTIPHALEGRDIIGIAATGTGKTAAFALPVLQRLIDSPGSAVIIIAPTRELAEQIESECKDLGRGSGLTGALLIGGTGMGNQLRDLRSQPRVVIGTPGRINDHLRRGTLQLTNFTTVVLDEVDRMLDMGFVHDVTTILSAVSATNRQSFFFSATMDPRVRTLIESFSSDPVTITLGGSAASDNVHQDVIRYSGNSDRLDKLHTLLIQADVSKAIIFDETQRGVERLHDELLARGFSVESIHGGRSQGQRQRALAKFKQSEATILVATDVAARGIDVADISHVINYSLPKAYDDYIHRIGRAGRAGRIGYALTFIS